MFNVFDVVLLQRYKSITNASTIPFYFHTSVHGCVTETNNHHSNTLKIFVQSINSII